MPMFQNVAEQLNICCEACPLCQAAKFLCCVYLPSGQTTFSSCNLKHATSQGLPEESFLGINSSFPSLIATRDSKDLVSVSTWKVNVKICRAALKIIQSVH